MTPVVQTVTSVLSVASLIGEICVIGLIGVLVYVKLTKNIPPIVRLISRHVLELGLFFSLAAFLLSIFYSNIAGFEPCLLCWWQRVFMYPQVVLFTVGLYYKKKKKMDIAPVLSATLVLSLVGGAIGLYQYYAQMFNPGLLSACGATGPSCAKLFFISFGHITIPFMSLLSFVVLIVLLVSHTLVERHSHA